MSYFGSDNQDEMSLRVSGDSKFLSGKYMMNQYEHETLMPKVQLQVVVSAALF